MEWAITKEISYLCGISCDLMTVNSAVSYINNTMVFIYIWKQECGIQNILVTLRFVDNGEVIIYEYA